MGELGLNEHHQDQLVQFLRFSRYQRSSRLRSVDVCFEETRKSRFSDTTFTRDEVLDILKGLQDVLHAELESELLNVSHTSLLLLRQLCGQAERWHLKLSANLSELENRELLDAVLAFEEQQFNLATSQKPQITVLKRLEPLEGGGAAHLLQTEIGRLRDENEKMRDRLHKIEGKAVNVAEIKNELSKQLDATKSELEATRKASSTTDKDVAELSSQMASMKGMLQTDLEKSRENQMKMEQDLSGTQKRLLEIQAQLEMTEKELERKFSQTAAYKNLKQILSKKNTQIKDLRSRLGKYEPDQKSDDD